MSNGKDSSPKYEVFLGGSCNPTTWRRDVAIPMLKEQSISFYNPQVQHWDEKLMAEEHQAKESAEVLFFVVNPLTRNVASFVELGYLAGCQRKLVCVVEDQYKRQQEICGEKITHREYDDLKEALKTVQDLIERQGIPIFETISHAVTCTAKIIHENMWPQDLGKEDNVTPVRFPYFQLGNKLIELHDAFINTNSDHLTLAEACVAYKVVTNKELTPEQLHAIVALKTDEKGSMNEADVRISFDELCCIVAEFKHSRLENGKRWDAMVLSLKLSMNKVLGWALPHRIPHTAPGARRDVYLGGPVSQQSLWREEIAVPMLRKYGLSYLNPAASISSGRLLPMEAALMDQSRVLLFVTTDSTRGVAALALAAHYIGLGFNVVLCIQMLKEGVVLDNEQSPLTILAAKDYNRGREYLRDLANCKGVPVFDNIHEAVNCAIQKCSTR